MSTPPHVATYRSRRPRTNGAPRRLLTTPSRSATRKICHYDRAVRRGEWRWQTGHPIWRIRGRIFGLVSFGSIARSIAERVRPFGVDIWAYDPFLDPTEIQRWNVRAVSFDKLVEAADYLVIQAPLTPETRHLFNRKTLPADEVDCYLHQYGAWPDR
jgi:phosphoglycerate dehydrogenase-like enzyme